MALPQDISPLNPELMDSVVRADQPWIPMDAEGTSFMKVLFAGAETGRWAVVLRWKKGYVAPPHKHLSAAHTYVLKGKLQIRDDTVEAGDSIYERNGMVHGATTALEDTEYLFICDGPVLFFDDDGFTSYLGWEEVQRMQDAFEKSQAA
jgi:anti-sigma factor ChrR (cupin superfamily)